MGINAVYVVIIYFLLIDFCCARTINPKSLIKD